MPDRVEFQSPGSIIIVGNYHQMEGTNFLAGGCTISKTFKEIQTFVLIFSSKNFVAQLIRVSKMVVWKKPFSEN